VSWRLQETVKQYRKAYRKSCTEFKTSILLISSVLHCALPTSLQISILPPFYITIISLREGDFNFLFASSHPSKDLRGGGGYIFHFSLLKGVKKVILTQK
jgi:hypothetical protein